MKTAFVVIPSVVRGPIFIIQFMILNQKIEVLQTCQLTKRVVIMLILISEICTVVLAD